MFVCPSFTVVKTSSIVSSISFHLNHDLQRFVPSTQLTASYLTLVDLINESFYFSVLDCREPEDPGKMYQNLGPINGMRGSSRKWLGCCRQQTDWTLCKEGFWQKIYFAGQSRPFFKIFNVDKNSASAWTTLPYMYHYPDKDGKRNQPDCHAEICNIICDP